MRGVTRPPAPEAPCPVISIHTPHAGSDSDFYKVQDVLDISIHTPHAGSDGYVYRVNGKGTISIHTPHAGSDSPGRDPGADQKRFQSTLPMRGVTRKINEHGGIT